MSGLEVWLSIVGITFATVLTRAGPLFLGREARLSPLVQSALRYAPACALAAIVLPDLLLTGEALDLSPANPRLVAGLAAAAVCLYTRGTLSTIAAGMAAFWAARWFGA